MACRSFAEQALHYFLRPHTSVPEGEVASPAAWVRAEARARSAEWTFTLDEGDLAELRAAVDGVRARGLAMKDVTREDFALPRLAPKVSTWSQILRDGLGLVLVRGLPVASWGVDDAALAYWGLGHHLGMPGAQNPEDELLGHIVDYGEEAANPLVRRYRTSGNIDFHCDAADVVGLLCLHPAREGGQSRIASSVAIYNRIVRQRPDLASRLFEFFLLDRRGEEKPGEPPFVPIPASRFDGRVLRTFYHSDYFRSAARFVDGGEHDPVTRELLDLYDSLATDPEVHLDMWLEAGDMQFISNHTVVHARTAYRDWPEPERRRHLLRLWLSLEAGNEGSPG